MNFPDLNSKAFTKAKFIGFFSAAVLLCVVILSSFWTPSAAPQEMKERKSLDIPGSQQLLQINQTLNLKWVPLELLYDEHAWSLADPAKSNSNTESRKQIMEAEVHYAKVLDSVSVNNATSPYIVKIDSAVNSFRATLQNRQTLNNTITEIASKNNTRVLPTNIVNKDQDQKVAALQNDLTAKNEMLAKLQLAVSTTSSNKNTLNVNEQKLQQMQSDLEAKTDMIKKLQSQMNIAYTNNNNSTANNQKILLLQNDVQSKSDMITKLQSQLKAGQVKSSGVGADEKKMNELQKDLQSKSAMITKLQGQLKALPARTLVDGSQSEGDNKKMKDELEFLKWALRSEVSSNHTLTNNINQLKQTNASLINQIKIK